MQCKSGAQGQSHVNVRWLTPDLISLVVRRSDGVQPAASCDSDGSNPKQIVDTASTDASQPDDEDLVHKSLSTSTAASGRQPDVAPDAPPSPVNASGPKPSQSSGDVADLDEDQAPVTPATSTGSQGSGKAGPLPTAQATVIATLKVPDAMGPSAEFDGTPVSSRHSSPPVSPRTKVSWPHIILGSGCLTEILQRLRIISLLSRLHLTMNGASSVSLSLALVSVVS